MPYSSNQLPSGLEAKVTPVDADVVVAGDSADSNRAKKVTWANVKATLKTYFDTLYNLYTHPNHSGEVTSTGDGAQVVNKTAITGRTTVTAVGADYILISDTSDTGNLKKALASDLVGAVEGTAVLSTGEVGAVKFLREDGDGTCSWQAVSISDTAYGVGWNGSTTTAPSQNAVYDEMELRAPKASPTFTGTVTLPIALTGVIRADTGVVSVDTDVTDIVAAGSESAAGKLELATDAETVTGTDTARATTPANITAKMAAPGAIGGTTPSTATFTTLTVNTGIVPDATDGAYLGTTTAQFSDLFLAEGGVINWDNGDAALTQVGNMVTLAGADLTVPNITVSDAGAITLGENTSIDLDGSLSADGKYSGTCISGTAGAALAFGDVVYLAAADSRWELTDADAVGTAGTVLVGICVLAAAGDGSATKILLNGTIRADAKFPTLTISAPVYIDTTTAGGVTVTAPTGADDVVRVLGFALTADSMYFAPSPDHITHTG